MVVAVIADTSPRLSFTSFDFFPDLIGPAFVCCPQVRVEVRGTHTHTPLPTE